MTIAQRISGLTIGTIESVAPNEFRVSIDTHAPDSAALNTGVPVPFPRINGYVLIPREGGLVVGVVTWLGMERSAFPKRPGLKDFGLIDLPFPLRKLAITPLGMLVSREGRQILERGIASFPAVGDPVLLPTESQLTTIVEGEIKDGSFRIGRAPLAAGKQIRVEPDRLFGRHLAILGNTGSGKSSTVASLVRKSVTQAQSFLAKRPPPAAPAPAFLTPAVPAPAVPAPAVPAPAVPAPAVPAPAVPAPAAPATAAPATAAPATAAPATAAPSPTASPNPAPLTRFIVLDPNGEYSACFADLPNVRRFQVPPATAGSSPLRVPAWLWNSQEWSAFAGAAPNVQRPLLLQALRNLRSESPGAPAATAAATMARRYEISLEHTLTSGQQANAALRDRMEIGGLMRAIHQDADAYTARLEQGAFRDLVAALGSASETVANRRASNQYYNQFTEQDVTEVLDAARMAAEGLPETELGLISEDAPVPFDIAELRDELHRIARAQGSGQAVQFIATLEMRIQTLLSDPRLAEIIAPDPAPTLAEWLTETLGPTNAGQTTVIDLSLVPTEIVHVTVAVLGRLVFEALQRHRRMGGELLPTVLILEEAHTFVARHGTSEGHSATPEIMCRNTFEKISREGRKFGLGLVLSSQRPSELSDTVLAQCNTFLLHRIVNDRDQDLVGRLVPDNLSGLLRDLPSLPSRQAILVGWATPVPILVEIDELPIEHRPRSADPQFWAAWTTQAAATEWSAIADEWTNDD